MFSVGTKVVADQNRLPDKQATFVAKEKCMINNRLHLIATVHIHLVRNKYGRTKTLNNEKLEPSTPSNNKGYLMQLWVHQKYFMHCN